MAESGRQRRNAQTWGELVNQQKASRLSVPAFAGARGSARGRFTRGGRGCVRDSFGGGRAGPVPAKEATSFIDLGALRDPFTNTLTVKEVWSRTRDEEGLSESASKRWLQTAASCDCKERWW